MVILNALVQKILKCITYAVYWGKLVILATTNHASVAKDL